MRTIIIEDQASVAIHLRTSIEALGHPVVGMTGSFATAVDLLMSSRDVDLAFIDLAMGDAARLPAGALLIDLAASRAIPVVVTTDGTPIPDQLKGVALLAKPYSADQVASVLASILKPAA
jgi:DNA-binding NarL/FixJ family response regulator